ncbi:MAG: hypothetical protein BJ554DRAFT_7623, partial [Olpidium bornovanus]
RCRWSVSFFPALAPAHVVENPAEARDSPNRVLSRARSRPVPGLASGRPTRAPVTNPLSPLTSRRQEGRLDYRNLVLDPEKAAYYQALLERPLSVGAGDERPQLPAPGPRDRARDQGKDAAATRTTGRTAAASHHDRPLLMRFRNAARQQQQQKPPPPLSAGRQELASWRQSAGTGAETSGRRPNGLTPAAEQKLCRGGVLQRERLFPARPPLFISPYSFGATSGTSPSGDARF